MSITRPLADPGSLAVQYVESMSLDFKSTPLRNSQIATLLPGGHSRANPGFTHDDGIPTPGAGTTAKPKLVSVKDEAVRDFVKPLVHHVQKERERGRDFEASRQLGRMCLGTVYILSMFNQSPCLAFLQGKPLSTQASEARSCKVVTACAGERALHAGERVAYSVAYADAQAQQHAVTSLRCR